MALKATMVAAPRPSGERGRAAAGATGAWAVTRQMALKATFGAAPRPPGGRVLAARRASDGPCSVGGGTAAAATWSSGKGGAAAAAGPAIAAMISPQLIRAST